MTDPIADLIGDYRAFTALQRDRLAARGIDIAPYELSHLAVASPSGTSTSTSGPSSSGTRSPTARTSGTAGRSRVVLAEPLRVLDGKVGPGHRAHPARPPARLQDGPRAPRRRRRRRVRRVLPRAPRGPDRPAVPERRRSSPYYVLFEDFTHVKFYRYSLRAGIELQGGSSRLPPRRRLGPAAAVTATGSNPLPR